mmetsp:Transcript_38895/g.54022  ORF Transcript_38895/g.54022 Transcript_38895/m.54022 type:complete len:388 (-) Transcript_38895:260-1423(-)|eukprot:CAMPEP_0196570300 /NCGR_PEP_ID=MMETSP1081-20130531/315_1 /TAXON_ID=36882 /ORGANISM="Pyramimonas amylifera, Strain CCMP720" /LENGTH=387 /DNA_ID=CAMNT_0041886655 /DNA_START=121 /DNA_END=1284 /DNA_ORIENTATION=+
MASNCLSASTSVPHVVPTVAASMNTSSRSVIKAKLQSVELSAKFSNKVTQVAVKGRRGLSASRRPFVVVADGEAEVAVEEPKPRSDRPPRREVTVKPEEVVEGATFKGTVAAVQPYGAFVNFGGRNDGLVHISELSDGFVSDVADIVSLGQEVEVRVIQVDKGSGKVSLSMKPEVSEAAPSAEAVASGEVSLDASGKPQRGKVATRGKKQGGAKKAALPAGVKKGGKYSAVVRTITLFGAFCELKLEDGTEGVQGLLHISEISDKRIEDVNEVLAVDQEVQVRVASIEGGKLNLTMKEELDIADLNAKANADVGPSFSVFELAMKTAGVSREQFPEVEPAAAPTPAPEPVVPAPVEAAPPTPEPETVAEAAPEVPKPEAPSSGAPTS